MHAAIELQDNVLTLKGNWLVDNIGEIDNWINHTLLSQATISHIDASCVTQMDTAGALLLHRLQEKLNENTPIQGLHQNFQALLDLVRAEVKQVLTAHTKEPRANFFYAVGKRSVFIFLHTLAFFSFFGEVCMTFWFMLLRPIKIQWRSVVHEIDVGGYRALPIIAVMMFLIGVVVAYQLGVQLKEYGANIYIVDLSGVAILREFSPLISSVIIAGRTSTSFAALIGTMKVNEELDALKTMGLSPVERLVLPKIIGLFVALPLLVVWGDAFGLFGSMVIAKNMASINTQAFLMRFKAEVAIKHLYIGLVKTPVFALIIAGIGCYQGFQAEGSAQSVGERTTKAAVQAIFLIILADGLFSILFNWMNL